MGDILITSIAGALGTVAFGVLYHVNPKHIPYAFLGGMMTTFTLVICLEFFDGNNLISNIFASFVGGMYCTLCAHKRQAPVPVFMIPTLFPLVPGRALYYSMSSLVLHNGAFIENFAAAAEISFGIAVGMMFSTVLCNSIISIYRRK